MRSRRVTVALLAALVLATIPVGTAHAAPSAPATAAPRTAGSPGCGSEGNHGLILYLHEVVDEGTAGATPNARGPRFELVAVTPTGKELHRIPIPDLPQLVAMRSGCRALAKAGNGEFDVVEAASGVVRKILLPQGVRGDLYLRFPGFDGSGGKRWTLIGGADFGGPPALLVDLDHATATDLTPIIGPGISGSAAFTPDEAYVLLLLNSLKGENLWLIPTANPRGARRLGTENQGHGGTFSADGRTVLYSRGTGAGPCEVVLESVDGSTSQVVAVSDGPGCLFGRFVPGRNQVLLSRFGRLSLLSLNDRFERDVLTLPEGTQAFPIAYIAPSGGRALVEDVVGGGSSWYLVDLGSGVASRPPELQGKHVWSTSPAPLRRWLLLSEANPEGQGVAGAALVSLDLESGAVHHLLAMDDKTYYDYSGTSSADGEFIILMIQLLSSGAGIQYRLIDTDTGASRLLAENGSGADISPDGSWVVLGNRSPGKPPWNSSVLLLEIGGNRQVPLGSGGGPHWLTP